MNYQDYLDILSAMEAAAKRIQYPLVDAGHLKRTVPEDTASRKQKYYSVKYSLSRGVV